MVEAGVADPATIDYALRELAGFRMGPLELTDLIGQDVNLAVGTSVWEQTGRDERYAPTGYQGHLPRRVTYALFVRTRDGRTEQVGTWRSLEGRTMRLTAATSTPRANIASVEVRTTDGRPVLHLTV